jgi:hypothetical protein
MALKNTDRYFVFAWCLRLFTKPFQRELQTPIIDAARWTLLVVCGLAEMLPAKRRQHF